jgi:N-acetylneuraminate synthase
MDKTKMICELGINHSGDINTAKKMIKKAKWAGADLVKFQKRTIDKVYTKEFLDSPRDSPWGTTQREQKEGLEFGKEEYDEINEYCKEIGIDWFASAWDIDSQKFLRQYGLKYNKIASPMLTNHELLKEVAKEGKHTFISTGMSTIDEISKATEIFLGEECKFTLMHCVSVYPCPDNLINLERITKLKYIFANDKFPLSTHEKCWCGVGYSGHELGIKPSIYAVIMGANVIERHFTLDRNMYGSDQKASLEPKQFKKMVQEIRKIETIMGDGGFDLSEEELKVKEKLRANK